jgi:hypothetical protein
MTSPIQPFIVDNQEILEFYNENPFFDFISVNLFIIKKLKEDMSDALITNTNNKILSTVQEMQRELSSNKYDLVTKLMETKKEYIDDVKTILSNQSLNTHEKLDTILERNNDTLITKTTLLMNEVIPKHNDKIYNQVEMGLKTFHNSLSQHTDKLADSSSKDEKTMNEFLSIVDTQFNKMITITQQPILQYIQNSEERIHRKMQEMKEQLTQQQTSNTSLSQNIHTFLHRYTNNSSEKGKISEIELRPLLEELFPTGEVIYCGATEGTCDFRVNRNENKPSILFENKNYTSNVPTIEVKKFENDLAKQKTHGIFVSHNSGITYKRNFQIDIINGIIHVYIPKAEFNIDKIRIAVDIIDSLAQNELEHKKYNNDDSNDAKSSFTISNDELNAILQRYNQFNSQKINIVNKLTSSLKEITNDINSLEMTEIRLLLTKHGMLLDDNIKCKFCNWTTIKTLNHKLSLASHHKGCSGYIQYKNEQRSTSTSEDDEASTTAPSPAPAPAPAPPTTTAPPKRTYRKN